MANVTMSVDDALLKKARKAAIDRNMSLSELFRMYLSDLAEREEAKRAFLAEELDKLFAESRASSSGRSWKREDLHER
jgi:antitoxin component of RelBE/YafQ-DinJ toxin-antitoxin module